MANLQWSISDAGQLALKSEQWDTLVGDLRYPPFLRAQFLVPALTAFGQKSALLALAFDGKNIAFAGIFERAGSRRWNVFQPSQLPLGACLLVPAYSWESVLSSLARAIPGRPLCLGVTQQDSQLVAQPRSSRRIETLEYVQTAWIEVQGSFEQFWQGRGKNLRQNLRKQRRKLEERGGSLKFEVLREPHEIGDALDSFAQLESESWKAAGGTAVTADNAQGQFYREMLLAFANSKRCAIAYRLGLNGKPIAVDFGIRDEHSVVILKTTYDESLKGISPAQLLHECAFQYHFERADVKRLEFYGKVMEWHTRWTEKSRPLYHITWIGSPLVRIARRLRHALHVASRERAS